VGPELGQCVIFKVNTTIESNHAGCGFSRMHIGSGEIAMAVAFPVVTGAKLARALSGTFAMQDPRHCQPFSDIQEIF